MKNNKGISLITLLVTVIVIIIIVSITAYNGVNLVDDTRKKDAEDKLRIICSAILKDDTFLNFSGNTEVTLNRADFDYMDLINYYDSGDVVKVTKKETEVDNTRNISYTLVMTDDETGDEYIYTFDYNLHEDKYNYDVSFNEAKGVNRPIIVDGMVALMSDGVTKVEDIYKDNWYNYEKGLSNFAKMKYQEKTYVWIPRFAYDIQNFYEGRTATNVPSSAINIVFLRGTSNYMQNDEVVQGEYKVHPAFIKDGTQYSGIWVEQSSNDVNNYNSIPADDDLIHLMTNNECLATIYLMYSLESMDEINYEKPEYIAYDNVNEEGSIDIDSMATAIYEKVNVEAPWDTIVSDQPTANKPYIIRRFDYGIFDFTNSDGTDRANYRGVIVIK